jgi:hypothetical protein
MNDHWPAGSAGSIVPAPVKAADALADTIKLHIFLEYTLLLACCTVLWAVRWSLLLKGRHLELLHFERPVTNKLLCY